MCFLGQVVKPLTNGTRLIFYPGSTAKIDWSFVDVIFQVKFRQWFFNSSDGSRTGQLAAIASDADIVQKNFSLIPGFDIEKPATLILKNVDRSYNGMYTFVIYTQSSPVTPIQV